MRLAIDASRCTVPRITGTERYAIELIREIIRQNTRHDITLYFRDAPAPDLFPQSEHVRYKVIPFRRAWTHLRFAAELWRDRPDVTFVPAHTLPVAFPGRAVVTVHDLGFRYFPDAHPAHQRLYLDWTTRYSAARATLVLADSGATARDLTTFYGTPPNKVRVVYPGVINPHPPAPSPTNHPHPPAPSPLRREGESESPSLVRSLPDRGRSGEGSIRAKYNLPECYFLFIGTLQPRKNIARLVEAFRLWQGTHPGDPTGLVLAGGKGWLYDPAWAEGVEGIHITGYIDEADKAALYSGALALVFPSLYEGFGFPVVEAMGCGAPVIASDTSSLPELVGDAGLLVNPLYVEAITSAMTRISDDAPLRDTLREKGYRQAATFTWAAAGAAALSALEEAGRSP